MRSGKRRTGFDKDPVAQLHTLEALMTLIIIIGVIIFTVQATSLTPLTSSTANAHIEAQLQTLGQDILNSLDHSQYGQTSGLKADITSWNGDPYTWDGNDYSNRSKAAPINSSTSEMLKIVVIPRGIAHNVELSWLDDTEMIRTIPYIYSGEPSDNAVIITKRVLISDSDLVAPADFASTMGIQDSDNSTDFYNLVDVRLTLWRM
ncbi:hypothetical protein V7O66_11695 [Methanolobus sp. ZRKC3]|uniref:DUF7288 family protein n=1 Tax=Methanolobus sp. ZRKC3 TaxID=3125786 RepID=UPI003253605F